MTYQVEQPNMGLVLSQLEGYLSETSHVIYEDEHLEIDLPEYRYKLLYDRGSIELVKQLNKVSKVRLMWALLM